MGKNAIIFEMDFYSHIFCLKLQVKIFEKFKISISKYLPNDIFREML